jgi:hypothetical protein
VRQVEKLHSYKYLEEAVAGRLPHQATPEALRPAGNEFPVVPDFPGCSGRSKKALDDFSDLAGNFERRRPDTPV